MKRFVFATLFLVFQFRASAEVPPSSSFVPGGFCHTDPIPVWDNLKMISKFEIYQGNNGHFVLQWNEFAEPPPPNTIPFPPKELFAVEYSENPDSKCLESTYHWSIAGEGGSEDFKLTTVFCEKFPMTGTIEYGDGTKRDITCDN